MEGRTIALLLAGVAAFALFRVISQWRGVARKRGPVDWDEQFIQQLRKAGVNTFEEQLVDFFFTLPSRAACEQVASALQPDGYSCDIREEAGSFSLHATRSVRLVVTEMQARTGQFNGLAAQHGGTYDNWAVARKK
jgi:hypothetical protein